MMKHYNFASNRIMVLDFTTTASMVNVAMNINRDQPYSEVRVIIRDSNDNLISNAVYTTISIPLNLSTVAGEKKVQFRVHSPNKVRAFNMAINAENAVPVKNLALEDFRKFIGLASIIIYGENNFSYLPHTLAALDNIYIAGSNTISSIPDSLVNLKSLAVMGMNTIPSIPAVLTKLNYINITGGNTISSIPVQMVLLETLIVTGLNTISVLPDAFVSLTRLTLSGRNTISSISAGFTEMKSLNISGNNTISVLPVFAKATDINVQGLNTIETMPNLSLMPLLVTFILGGRNTVNYDVANLPSHIKDFRIVGGFCTTTYSGKSWPATMSGLFLSPKIGGGLTSAMVDLLLGDLTAVTTWAWPFTVDLRGANQPRTSASNAAVASLVAKGVTVTTN